MGTGPYKFKSYDAGASYSVVKNPDYFVKGRPYVDGITWYIIKDVATRFAALRTHRANIPGWGSTGLTPGQGEIIRKELSDKLEIRRHSSLIFQGLWMLQTKAPFNDLKVRRATSMALDRPKIINVAAEGLAQGRAHEDARISPTEGCRHRGGEEAPG
ncbi:MAG: hypothetical protein HYX92_10410 [Chloroflexi bacterium]|nr:hypothetical protein [Chloroflexota bacterium]